MILVLLPGAVLAWLGWQSASTFEAQARDLARREAEAVGAQVELRAAARVSKLEPAYARGAENAAALLRQRLPAETWAGH